MRFAFLLAIALFSHSGFSNNETRSERVVPMIFQPQLYGGTKSLPTEFLPMGWIGNCTGTAVGAKTVFTAAHCVTNGKRIKFESRHTKQSHAGTCYRHPRVRTASWYNDFALCLLDQELPADHPKATFVFRKPDVGEKLLLNGYGAPTVGTHHWGGETVDGFDGQDIEMCGRVYLGGGDSGGSLLAWSEDRTGKTGLDVLGVNSRGGGNCSYFNGFYDGEFKAFATPWDADKDKLCGLGLNCKGGTPPPPSPSPTPIPPPPPANCWQTYEEYAFCIGTKSLPACLKRADQLKACVM